MVEAAMVETRDGSCDGARIVRLRVPAHVEYVGLARLALGGLAELAAMAEATLADLKLALSEAVASVVGHAGGAAGVGVEISFELGATAIEIEVEAVGGAPAPASSGPRVPEELAEGERRLATIRALVDELEVGAGERGPRLRLAKALRRE
jgi:serine/threonine-protein kinase RsbW